MSMRLMVAIFVWLLAAHPAMAQLSQESAGALFVRARSMMKAGDCVSALPLLEQSHALEPALGTRLNIAICEVQVGKLVEAAANLQSVIGASTPEDGRRAHAERVLGELLPRIPQLVLALDDSSRSLEHVSLDGEPVETLRVNEPFRINPGTHELEVVLAREPKLVRRFSVAERQVFTWSLGGIGAPVVAAASSSPENEPSDHAAASQPEATPSVWTRERKVAAIAAGTSLVALGVGTGFALSARSVYDSSAGDCTPDDVCKPEGMSGSAPATTGK